MSQQHDVIITEREDRLELALQAFASGQFRSQRRAAVVFNVDHQQLSNLLKRIASQHAARPNCHKLTATEGQTIVRYILDLDSRGSAPRLCEVADMADKLLAVRGWKPVGRKWAARFVTRSDELKMASNRDIPSRPSLSTKGTSTSLRGSRRQIYRAIEALCLGERLDKQRAWSGVDEAL